MLVSGTSTYSHIPFSVRNAVCPLWYFNRDHVSQFKPISIHSITLRQKGQEYVCIAQWRTIGEDYSAQVNT